MDLDLVGRQAVLAGEQAFQLRGEGHAIAAGERIEPGQRLLLRQRRCGTGHPAVLRVRPKAMTVAVILAGLVPIVWSSGTGSEVMSRIAAPMLGGMVTAPLLSLFVIPAAYVLMRKPRKRDQLDT